MSTNHFSGGSPLRFKANSRPEFLDLILCGKTCVVVTAKCGLVAAIGSGGQSRTSFVWSLKKDERMPAT